jgi:hypothetical protein
MRLDSLNGFQQKHLNSQSINHPLAENDNKHCNSLVLTFSPRLKKINEITTTYGFTSFALLNYIKKTVPVILPQMKSIQASSLITSSYCHSTVIFPC